MTLLGDGQKQWRDSAVLREKHQKFGILDSPTLLERDLAKACGVLGRAVLYLDLDDFKKINTQLTEVLVDRLILPPLHELLAKCVQGLGSAYAEGGDEFTILLPNSSEEMALKFAQALRNQISALRLDGVDRDIQLTVSIGVAHGAPGEDGQVLRERANLAKKHAKEHGKNRVSLWAPALGESVAAAILSGKHDRRAKIRVRGLGLAIVTILLLGAVGVFWILTRPSHQLAPANDAAQVAGPFSEAVPENSIAVLPFADMSETHDQEYFSDGLAEELLDLLAKTPGLHVVARTSSFSFKGKSDDIPTIARKLHVANILEGGVRKSANHLRVTTQLIRAETGVHIWSETYDRELNDVFSVQDEIAAAVVAALKIHLLQAQSVASAHRTSNTDAYNAYLLGRHLYNRGTLDSRREAVEAYRKALALDPNYAAVYAGLAMAEYYVADQTGDTAGLIRAEAEADKAVALSPDAAEAYGARGFMRYASKWDWVGAQADFAKALALDPGDSVVQRRYAQLLVSLGRLPEGIAATRKATELDPLSNPAWGNLGLALIYNHEFTAAHEALRRALEIQPEFPFALNNLGTLQMLEAKPAEALLTFRKIEHEAFRLPGIAMAEHTLGHERESQEALEEAIAKGAQGAAYQIAEVYAWRGETERALDWLERAYAQRDGGLVDVKVDPRVASVRGQPRYDALLRAMDLSK